MSDQVAPIHPHQSRRISVKRHSVGLGYRENVVFNYQTLISKDHQISLPLKIEYLLSTKIAAYFLTILIAIYTGLVVIRIAFDSETAPANTALDILELVFLSIFVFEVALRIFAYKLTYFKDVWNIIDILIITVCLIVIISSLSNSSIVESQAYKVGQVLRIFRLFLMFRKLGSIRKYRDKIVKKKSDLINVTSPSEKIIEILQNILDLEWMSYQSELKIEIEWAIVMIKDQKIYQTNVRAVKEELRDLVNWAVNQTPYEEEEDEETPVRTETHLNPFSSKRYDPDIELMLSESHKWEFDLFELEKKVENKTLEIICSYIFSNYGLIQSLSLENTKFTNFIQQIQAGYHKENSYHNSVHAADVVQSFYYFLHSCQAIEIATLVDFDIAICLISAAIHDFDHPGLNNLYLINTSSTLALIYNDKSVLENHHVASAFKLLLEESNNFIEKFSKDDKKKFRFKVVSLVLATDFARHFADIGKFQLKFSNPVIRDDEDRMLVMEMLMHTSDIGNPSRPWKICHEWANRVMTEFFLQGDRERDLGLPISNLCDRFTVSVPRSQVGFTELFIEPTFNLLENLLPAVSENLRNIAENKEKWKDLIELQKSAV